MTIRTRSFIAAVIIVAATVAAGMPPAHAQNANELTWSVQPATESGPDTRPGFDYSVKPGATISDKVVVRNFSKASAVFRVYAADAVTDYDTASFTLIGAEAASLGLGSWTSIAGQKAACPDTNDAAEEECAGKLGITVTVKAGESRVLPFTVTVPHDAAPGDHAAGIVAAYETTSTDASGASVKVSSRTGSRIYLRVDGPLDPQLGVSGVVSSYDVAWNPLSGGTGHVGFDVTNRGNMRLSAQPVVTVSGPFGIQLASVSLPAVKNILPGGTGHVTADLGGLPPVLLLFSDVTITPLAADGDDTVEGLPAPSTASSMMWAIPWTILATIVVVGGGTWFFLWWRKRSRQVMADELAAYTDHVREQALAEASRPAPDRADET